VNHLERIIAATREEVGRRRTAVPESELQRVSAERAQAGDVRDFGQAVARPGLSLIAEHKRRSPSAGTIREGLALEQIVAAYERAGAAALSILTDGPSFGGSLADLQAARASSRLPILRKDFIIDPYQLRESFAAGADAILLVVAALSQPVLTQLRRLALELGLAALVEVHDGAELARAAAAGAQMIGINNRDLATLRVDTRRTYELLESIPAGTLVVAESGFSARAELEALSEAGVDGVLIGEALMRSDDIEAACRELAVL
jgi:indole-3-glycerol phosphate synthase